MWCPPRAVGVRPVAMQSRRRALPGREHQPRPRAVPHRYDGFLVIALPPGQQPKAEVRQSDMPGIALLLLQGEALVVQRRRANIVAAHRKRLGQLVCADVNPDTVATLPVSAQCLVENGDGPLEVVVVVETNAESERREVGSWSVAERVVQLQALLEQRHGSGRVALDVCHETGDIQSIGTSPTGSSLL